MKKIAILLMLISSFHFFYNSFAMEERKPTSMETGGDPTKRKFSEISKTPEKEKEKEKEHIPQCPVPRKRRRIEPKAVTVLPLRELAKQKFIEVAPGLENLPQLLESIPAEEVREEIKSESQKPLSYEETRLHNARSELEVENLLTLGVDPNVKDRDGRTALNALINKGFLDAAFHLLALKGKDLDISSPDIHGVTPLQAAIKHQDIELATFIVEILKEQDNEDSIYNYDSNHWTALMLAIRYLPELIDTFQQFGLDLKHLEPDTQYKLMSTAALYNANAIQPLIKAALYVNIADSKTGNTPLMMAAASNPQAVASLLNSGADPNIQNKSGDTALMYAITAKDLEALQLLINASADINIENKKGFTPLFQAAVSNPKTIDLLIKAGADPNKANFYGKFPLFEAGKAHSLEGVKKLLEFGANANASNRTLPGKSQTALEVAIVGNKPEIVKALLDAGADPNAKNYNNTTALMLAAQFQPAAVLLLLDKGADPNAQDDNGFTALMHAIMSAQSNTIKVLIDAGADPNAKESNGSNGLTLAIRLPFPNLGTVKMLLDTGAQLTDADIKAAISKFGEQKFLHAYQESALYHAIIQGNFKAAKMLLDVGVQVTQRHVEAAEGKFEIQKLLHEYFEKLFTQQ